LVASASTLNTNADTQANLKGLIAADISPEFVLQIMKKQWVYLEICRRKQKKSSQRLSIAFFCL
jgi:hypothetical protein